VFKKIATRALIIGLFLIFCTSFKLSENIIYTSLAVHILLIINLVGLFWLYKFVAVKKSIALGVLLIILKYPLLGYIVVKLVRQSWFDSVGLVMGFITFLSSIVIVTLLKHFKKL